MQSNTLNAAIRNGNGKGAARKLRASGQIPATVYGGGGDPVSLALDPNDIVILRRGALGWNTPLAVAVDGGDDIPLVLLRDVQQHPISGTLLHVDLQRVAVDEEVEVRIRLDLAGKSAGVALGGRVNRPVRSVQVKCLPKDIPEAVVIDITDLVIGDRVMIDDLPVGEGVRVLFTERVPVLSVVGRRGMTTDEEESAEGAEGEEVEEEAAE